jgi:hypothetical protein
MVRGPDGLSPAPLKGSQLTKPRSTGLSKSGSLYDACGRSDSTPKGFASFRPALT